jgi:hypothetical protein
LNAKCTRRRFLGAAAAVAVWVALGGTVGCESNKLLRVTASHARAGQAWTFRSRPDLSPPVIEVIAQARDTAPGYIFVAPKNGPGEAGPGQDGCLILDNTGQPIWFRPVAREAMDVMDLKLQRYRGLPVLTWWEGEHTTATAEGSTWSSTAPTARWRGCGPETATKATTTSSS